jgi:acyl-CoA thioester hydrolase
MAVDRAPLHVRSDYHAWHRITTRWSDNDMYGHVNNVVYYSWFDTAVNYWLIDNGLLTLDQASIIGVVAHSACRYGSALSYPGDVEIGIAIDRIGTSSVTYRLGVFASESAIPSAEGVFTHVYVDQVFRRPLPLPPEWRSALTLLSRKASPHAASDQPD